MVTSTAAVNAGYPFNNRYPCPSSYSVGSQTFTNFESQGHGDITIGRALEVSCDTVYYAIADQEWKKDGGIKPKKDPKDWFLKTAHEFGLGKRTGIDLPNEVPGRVPDRQVEAGLLRREQGRLVPGRQEERLLRREDRLRELPPGQPAARG